MHAELRYIMYCSHYTDMNVLLCVIIVLRPVVYLTPCMTVCGLEVSEVD